MEKRASNVRAAFTVYFLAANAPGKLASKPAKIVYADETEAFAGPPLQRLALPLTEEQARALCAGCILSGRGVLQFFSCGLWKADYYMPNYLHPVYGSPRNLNEMVRDAVKDGWTHYRFNDQ